MVGDGRSPPAFAPMTRHTAVVPDPESEMGVAEINSHVL